MNENDNFKVLLFEKKELKNVTMMQIQVQICHIVKITTNSVKGVKFLAILNFQQYIFPPTKVRKILD